LAELAARALEGPPFTRAERALLAAAEDGGAARGGPGADPDPAGAAAWGPERTVRADLVRWLCTHPEAARRVHPRGLSLHGARVTHPLDLAHVAVPFPLRLVRCALLPGLVFADADLARLTLSGCRVGPLRADRLVARGPVTIADGTRVLGGARLCDATVLGDLCLRGAALINGGAVALAASRLTVEGDLLLDGAFRALGAVRLIDATVAGDLDCRGGRFLNRGGVALACDRIQVGGRTHLDAGFKAYGAVRLLDARVHGGTHGHASTTDARGARGSRTPARSAQVSR